MQAYRRFPPLQYSVHNPENGAGQAFVASPHRFFATFCTAFRNPEFRITATSGRYEVVPAACRSDYFYRIWLIWFDLFFHNVLDEPHQDGRDLGPGRIALGVEICLAVRCQRAGDEALSIRPSQGPAGIGGDIVHIREGRQVRNLIRVVLRILRVTVEDRRQLLPGDVPIGGEFRLGCAVDDAVLVRPNHGAGVIRVRRDVREVVLDVLHAGAACQAVQDGDKHRPGHGQVRGEGLVRRTVEQAALEDEVDAQMRPVVAIRRV